MIDKVESSGAVCDLHHYMAGFSPNVICTYPSLDNSSEHVILSAHYDSRGSFGNTRAPGGDDDGSGTGHLLSVVEAIKRGKVEFSKKVQVAFFSGEEQGLYGSHAYAGMSNESGVG
jgi:Zn-dependent M28 family amino/carboxypeptidase